MEKIGDYNDMVISLSDFCGPPPPLTAVPEPSTLVMFGIGLVSAGVLTIVQNRRIFRGKVGRPLAENQTTA